jgi:hypothetical protein
MPAVKGSIGGQAIKHGLQHFLEEDGGKILRRFAYLFVVSSRLGTPLLG